MPDLNANGTVKLSLGQRPDIHEISFHRNSFASALSFTSASTICGMPVRRRLLLITSWALKQSRVLQHFNSRLYYHSINACLCNMDTAHAMPQARQRLLYAINRAAIRQAAISFAKLLLRRVCCQLVPCHVEQGLLGQQRQ